MIEAAPNPDVSEAALWIHYRAARSDIPDVARKGNAMMHLVACAHRDEIVRATARVMLRALLRTANARTVEAPCA